MDRTEIGVLGPLTITSGPPRVLRKARLRELLSILVIAHGRAVSSPAIIDDLWEGTPPAGALGAVRTFVGELRKVLEPERSPHSRPGLLVTEPTGYALRISDQAVDVWRVTDAVKQADGSSPRTAVTVLSGALGQWRGDAYEEFADRPWARAERARLSALRADIVERLAAAQTADGRVQDAIALLGPHVTQHPWREDGWRLLATALHRANRPAESLEVLRRARRELAEGLGLDPGAALSDLEQQILRRTEPGWTDSGLAALDRGPSRARLEASGAVLTSLAVSGDLATVRAQRLSSIRAAEHLGDPLLTARVIGGLEAPGVWTRSDDPALALEVVAAAERTLPRLPSSPSARARLLASIALEDRGTASRQSESREALELARASGDQRLLCHALSGRFMQQFSTAGLAAARAETGRAIVEAAQRAESATYEICGRIIRMQALCALDQTDDAAKEADLVDALSEQAERPLAATFTAWFRHTFGSEPEPAASAEMPGFSSGLSTLSRVTRGLTNGTQLPDGDLADGDLGPYEPWVRPLLLVRQGDRAGARAALRDAADPPRDLLLETTWVLVAVAAREADDQDMLDRAMRALEPARTERAAGSGAIDLGPVRQFITPS